MTREDEQFLKRLLATFKIEAEEHLNAMSSLLSALENPAAAEQLPMLIETLFREAHSLKGAARSVNQGDIEALCQSLESVLAALKQQEIRLSPAFADVLYRAVDLLGRLLATSGDAQASPVRSQIAPLVQELEQIRRGCVPGGHPAASVAAPAETASPEPVMADRQADATVRISTAKLGALLIQAEELLAFKFSAGHMADELRLLRGELTAWKKNWRKTVRDTRMIRRTTERHGNGTHNGSKVPTLEILLDAVERDEFFAKSIVDRFAQLERSASQERRALSGMVDNLLDDMKQTLMLPFSSLLEVFPRLVRDLARDSGKEVDLHVDGAAIEIDRRILEQMKDPLIHLIRNAIGHGIESSDERADKGKPLRGRIAIDIIAREGNKIDLTVTDDGRGIDIGKVTDMALRLGLVAPELADDLSETDALALVFESGLSTSPILTDISGRGLGLAIVREKVEKLDGSVTVESPATGGTRFCIVLPATLTTFRGVLVGVCARQFVLPSRSVERVARLAPSVVKTVENRETIELENQVISLVHLGDVLGLESTRADASHLLVAILTSGGKRIAFAVDEVFADQEVLVKGLGPQLIRVPNIAGATVLGAGRVVPILNVADLLKSALKTEATQWRQPEQAPTPRLSVLVVEDSITSRALLKNILESAGYDVTTTVDGIAALTALRSGQFHLVVSDVEMPRMDGFDLTAKIRADQRLAELPVVLVTALDSREHKERGIDVGANAYIVKSSFDQSNLLDVVRRLI